MSIAPIKPIAASPELLGIEPSRKAEKPVELGNAFTDALQSATKLEKTATEQATKFADGDPSIGIHEVVIASEKANIALRFATTLKNKALEAYRELMQTQV